MSNAKPIAAMMQISHCVRVNLWDIGVIIDIPVPRPVV